jgi:hypothetical protein
MENALTGIIIIGVMILAILGLSEGALSAQANLAEASRAMQERLTDQARTDLTMLSVSVSGMDYTWVDITVKNTGNLKLADFSHWDVILTYTDFTSAVHADWHSNWTKQIYTTATSDLEKIEPGILNPGEEMVISVQVSSTIKAGATNVVTVGTPNGITATASFTR